MKKSLKAKPAKKRNATDSTTRNVRASQARDDRLEARVQALEDRFAAMDAEEEAAAKDRAAQALAEIDHDDL